MRGIDWALILCVGQGAAVERRAIGDTDRELPFLQLVDLGQIVGGAAHDLAGRHSMKEAWTEAMHLLDHLVAQVVLDVSTNVEHLDPGCGSNEMTLQEMYGRLGVWNIRAPR